VLIISGTMGPRMLLSREMTKNTRKMRPTRNRFLAIAVFS
jgi:hypothetical protein